MARVSELQEGRSYRVLDGERKGHRVQVLSTKVVPDGKRNARKIRVRDLTTQNTLYILPRVIDATGTGESARQREAKQARPGVHLHVAPVTPEALRELAKISSRERQEDPRVLLALVGNFTEEQLDQIAEVLGQ